MVDSYSILFGVGGGAAPLSGGWVGGDGLAGVEIIRPKADLSTAVMDYPPEN